MVGASSGIGRETALGLVRRGAKVIAAARDRAGLESLVQEIALEGGRAVAVVADVSKYAEVQAIADRAILEFHHLDTWVHLAAVSLYATFEQTTPEEFARVVEVNFIGQAYGAMVALPYLKREGRCALIHVSSVESRRGFPLQSAYSSAKHGITGMVEALRVELAKEGAPISVTEVIPASINTPLFNRARTKLGVQPAPIPPVYEPGVVADAILYAAEHPTREIIAGGAGVLLVQSQKLTPRVLDALQQRLGFAGQKSGRPKGENDPNNLFAPMQDQARVRGDYGHFAFPFSAYAWLTTHRAFRTIGMAGLALGVTALVATRVLLNTLT